MNAHRGEVYLVNLDPTIGKEIKKLRPAVVVSSNAINSSDTIVIVCPITDANAKSTPIHILVPRREGGLMKDGVAHCAQIRAVDSSRLYQKIGNLALLSMRQIDQGMKTALALV